MNSSTREPCERERSSPPPGCSPNGSGAELAKKEAEMEEPLPTSGTPPDHGGQEGTPTADAAPLSPPAGEGEDEEAEELSELLAGEREPSAAHAPPKRDEDIMADAWRAHRKHVFVLSEAGKPIYSRYGNEEALSSTMGVMMALVSFVQAGNNLIRSIQADDYQVVFSQEGPLVLVCVSRGRQSERQLRRELLYVYQQILSMLTRATLTRVFRRKQSFDLRRLLAGSEKILDGLLRRLEREPGPLLGAVRCLTLAAPLREAAGQLLRRAAAPNLVFSILVAGGSLVTIVQERVVIEEARLDPADLQLLFNLLAASSSFQAGEVWAPICLPRLCPDGYLYAYVSYLDPPACRLCLLLLSTDRDAFYAAAACKRRIEEGLRAQGLLRAIGEALGDGGGVSPPGIADLWHFMYKPLDVPENHRQLTQYASPEMKAPYYTEEERERLFDLYQYLHGRVHSASRPLRLVYHVAAKETLLAWVTPRFELYACFSPLVTKGGAIGLLTLLLRWLRKEEGNLFLCAPPRYSTSPGPPRAQGHLSPNNGLPSLL
ncbi:vacuolar fusion protein MON1 homolog B-like isoform X2 [Mobula birostris]|uniref:vacuolar fusion protein MON1 homolog B-like isoform X2 n=1 Tax=Mobula birostris TaxID=1983395 RepID=UPI003B27D2B2